jgi:hypothetical protein
MVAGRRERFDVGTSLGNLGHDPAKFFSHAESTNALVRSVLFVLFGCFVGWLLVFVDFAELVSW